MGFILFSICLHQTAGRPWPPYSCLAACFLAGPLDHLQLNGPRIGSRQRRLTATHLHATLVYLPAKPATVLVESTRSRKRGTLITTNPVHGYRVATLATGIMSMDVDRKLHTAVRRKNCTKYDAAAISPLTVGHEEHRWAQTSLARGQHLMLATWNANTGCHIRMQPSFAAVMGDGSAQRAK